MRETCVTMDTQEFWHGVHAKLTQEEIEERKRVIRINEMRYQAIKVYNTPMGSDVVSKIKKIYAEEEAKKTSRGMKVLDKTGPSMFKSLVKPKKKAKK